MFKTQTSLLAECHAQKSVFFGFCICETCICLGFSILYFVFGEEFCFLCIYLFSEFCAFCAKRLRLRSGRFRCLLILGSQWVILLCGMFAREIRQRPNRTQMRPEVKVDRCTYLCGSGDRHDRGLCLPSLLASAVVLKLIFRFPDPLTHLE